MKLARILVLAFLAVAALMAQGKPISRRGLGEALRIGGLTPQELVQLVQQRGVDFQLTAEAEKELRAAGARPELLAAVRANYRGAPTAPETVPAPPPAGAPLSKNEILTLLQVGTPPARVEQIVAERGVSFAMSADIAREIEAAGGNASLVAALYQKQAAAAPAPRPAARAAAPTATSLKEVRKLFIEQMANDLDAYLRAEVAEQLSGRITVVLKREEAEGVMSGTSQQRTGTTAAVTGKGLGLHDRATGSVKITDRTGQNVLWASEAGDRSLVLGAFKKGGPKKVAERLIENLKKALQQQW